LLLLVTTVLDPEKLSASAALALYRRRWSVEQMFQDLKQVLRLRRFFASNTNAVGMQLYATAICHVALRVSQAQIAMAHERRPEELSTKKLFPRMAAAEFRLVEALQIADGFRRANPHIELRDPDWAALGLYSVPLRTVLVTKRAGTRPSPNHSPRRQLTVTLQTYEQRNRPPVRGP